MNEDQELNSILEEYDASFAVNINYTSIISRKLIKYTHFEANILNLNN